MELKMKWIKIRPEKGVLWTADLIEDDKLTKNIGGAYSKITPLIKDAQLTWGELNYRIVQPS